MHSIRHSSAHITEIKKVSAIVFNGTMLAVTFVVLIQMVSGFEHSY